MLVRTWMAYAKPENARAYRDHGLTFDQFESAAYKRLPRIRELLAAGRLNADLRWSSPGGLLQPPSPRE